MIPTLVMIVDVCEVEYLRLNANVRVADDDIARIKGFRRL